MKTFILFALLSVSSVFAQGPGQPQYPETANGASNVYFQYHSLKWQNPPGTIYNEVYLSYDSSKVANLDPSALYISGYPATAFDSIRINQQLYFPTRYFWCVVEYNSNGSTQGYVWYFTTTRDNIDFTQMDDFSFGLGKWTINNITSCGWQLGNVVNYTLPDPSTDQVLTADATLCGNPINAIAYFQQADNMEYMYGANIEFNSDWKADNPNDVALVEMSTDGGYTWSIIWQKTGVSDRNNQVVLTLFDSNWFTDTIYTVQVRFKTIQYGTNSWWAIDNVSIVAYNGILTHVHPTSLHTEVIYENQKVKLTWQQILPVPGETVERKEGLPTSNNPYQIIAEVPGSYTNTYIDSTVNDSTIYTYRIGFNEFMPWAVFSNEATAYIFPPVPVELISFTANAISRDVLLNWSTATEINNQGFEIQRCEKSAVQSPNWQKIGFVNGHGTTTEPQFYSFTDESLPPGKYQYKLKQIDFDGTFEYSKVVEVTVQEPTEFSLSQNYPNPFNPTTHFEFRIANFGFVSLKVYDVLGNEVATLINEEKPAGEYEVKFDGSGLTSGIYFYQLKAGNYIETKKMVLMK